MSEENLKKKKKRTIAVIEEELPKADSGSEPLSEPTNSADKEIPIPVLHEQDFKPPPFIKTGSRGGRKIYIKTNRDMPSDNSGHFNEIEENINKLHAEAKKKSASTNQQASIYKIIYTLSTIFISLAGIALGVLNLMINNEMTAISYVVSALGFAITAIQTCVTVFSIEKRGVLLRDISHKLKSLFREANSLRYSNLSAEELELELKSLYNKMDDYDIAAYDNNITSLDNKVTQEV